MRKIFIVLLCFLLMGCTDVDNKGQYKQEKEQTVIKWMVYGSVYKESERVFEKFNRELKKKFKNTTVEFEIVDKEKYKARWDMKIATDEAFDLAWIGYDCFNFTEEVKKGSLMALDYLLTTEGITLMDNIPKELWKLQIRDGNIFAIPIEGLLHKKSLYATTKKYYLDVSEQSNQIEAINISHPYTNKACYESFEAYLSFAKTRESIGTGVSYESFSAIADKGLEGIYGNDSPFVIKIFDDKPIVYNKYKLDTYKDYFETMARWYELGYIRKDVADVINTSNQDGKHGGSILFLDEYADYIEDDERIPVEYEAAYIPLERYKYIPYDACRNAIVIPKNSENPQRAIEIINFLVSEEGEELYKLLVHGIEKEHYIKIDDNKIVRRRDNDKNLLYSLSKNTIADTFQSFELTEQQFEKVNEENQNAVPSKLIGFNLDTRMIAINLEKVSLVIDEYENALRQGASDDWQVLYDELISKMEEAGSEKIIDEMQIQIDDFMESSQQKIPK